MKTPSHAFLGFFFAKAFGFSKAETTACVLGACLADAPLIVAYLYFVVEVYLIKGIFDAAYVKFLMDQIYFHDSWLLITHNLFHSPVSIGYLVLITLICCLKKPFLQKLSLAYLLGSFSHSMLDIISHTYDGPLVLWPLENSVRFESWFSHWIIGEGGMVLGAIELVLLVIMIGYWLRLHVKKLKIL